MKKYIISFAFFMMLFFTYAGENTALISKELVMSKSISELQEIWKKAGIPKIIAPIKNGVNIYEVIYNTTYIDGKTIKASGVYFAPIEVKENLPVVVYFHGTQIEKERKIKVGGEMAICTGLAADGYAALYVDYMGIGKGDGFHIYQHSETEARAGLDMLIAVEEMNSSLGYSFSDLLFTTGYSQGGHAAISFHRYIQEHPEFGYKITASSPMSGAYDMAGAQTRAMFEPYSHPGYLPYLLAGYNEAYHLYPDLKSIYKSPYDSIIPPMFDGKHSMGDINHIMPDIPSEIVKDEIVAAYKANVNDPFRLALIENSFLNWKPESPVQLCYCKADEQVYYENTINTYNAMKTLGAENVHKRSVGRKFGHNTCAMYAALYTKMYFDSFAKKDKVNGKKGPAFKRFLVSISKIRVRRDVRHEKKEGKYSERHKSE